MTSSIAQQHKLRANFDELTLPPPAVEPCGGVSTTDVGLGRVISDAELEKHIADCHFLGSLARARFRGSRNPTDAAEGQAWDCAKEHVIKARQTAHLERQAQAKALERLDELTFHGNWPDKLGVKCDVPAAAVRRRVSGGR